MSSQTPGPGDVGSAARQVLTSEAEVGASDSARPRGLLLRLGWLWVLLAGIGAYLLLLRTLVVTQNPSSLVRIVVALFTFIALMLTLVAARRAEASRAPQMSSL